MFPCQQMARRGRSGGRTPQQPEQPVEGLVEDIPLDQDGNEIEELLEVLDFLPPLWAMQQFLLGLRLRHHF